MSELNWARQNRHLLEDANYVRNTNKSSRYYIELLPSGLIPLTRRFGEGWCVVICGEPHLRDDYWVIPSRLVSPFLKQEYMSTKEKDNPLPVRWLFQVKGGLLNFFPPKDVSAQVSDRIIDMTPYYGNFSALFSPIR